MKHGKAIIVSIVALSVVGALYYFLIYKKPKGNIPNGNTNVNEADAETKGKYAEFLVDGFVYSVGTKAQAYPKKAGQFGGSMPTTYADDTNYWTAYNSNGKEILLKKSDVKIV